MSLIFNPNRDAAAGVWCEYEPGVRVKIRPLTRSLFRNLQREATTRETVVERGRRAVQEKVDQDALDRLLYSRLIEDWEGVVDPEGAALPCTDEMKNMVCDCLGGLAAWVIEEAGSLAEGRDAARREALKN